MSEQIDVAALFERRISYPDPGAKRRLDRLVGIDDNKVRLSKILGLLVNRTGLEKWASTHHPEAQLLLETVTRRPPLVILAGDVGSGKTELAETIGDMVARAEGIDITLLPLSLASRGQGMVGQMTTLLTAAFDYTANQAAKLKASGRSRGAIILLVDEADALAQSRESAQMHHEDRSGVNAFIRGIDRLANEQLPAAVIMCTNRLSALDPAVRRRAADLLAFDRPDDARRREILAPRLKPLGFSDTEIESMISLTGSPDKHKPGFTFSDLTQRLLPAIVLDAYPEHAVMPKRALEIAREMVPTPPFRDEPA